MRGTEVGDDAGEAFGLARGIKVALTTRHEPAVQAIKAAQAHGFLERRARGNGVACPHHQASALIRVQPFAQVKVLRKILAPVVQQTLQAGRCRALPGTQIPVPHAAAAALQRQAQPGFAALKGGAGGVYLADVLHHAHQVGGIGARLGHQRDGTHHGHDGPRVRALALALALVVVDFASQQALALVIGPVAVRRPDDVAKLVLAQVLEAHAGQFAKALVGPEYLAVGAGTHNARRRMAQHMCGLLRCGGAKVVSSAGAPQQPPSQRASDQHIKRILDRAVARQQVGVRDQTVQ